MKHLLILLIVLSTLMMVSKSSFSQNSFPKKLVLESDTVFALLPYQFVAVNKIMLRGQMYKMRSINLRSQIMDLKALMGLMEDMGRLDKKKYLNLTNQLKTIENSHELEKVAMNKQKRKEKRKSFLVGGALGAVVVLVIGILI